MVCRRLLCALGCAALVRASSTVNVSFAALGRRFDGLGALSGGGGVTRLLVDYDPKVRSEVLDTLFKPFSGAALHWLKVEIGGDTQSTEGTEPSHMHSREDLNYHRGYEWWMMREARSRSPEIELYGLSWGVPGWIGNGSFFSQDNIDYHVKWLEGARDAHGLGSEFTIGEWNERSYDMDWTIRLRGAMDAAGFESSRIILADRDWAVVDDLASNASFSAAVDVVGVHYPASHPAKSSGGLPPPKAALELGKPLWASEFWDLGKVADFEGALRLAQCINDNWVSGEVSAGIIWNTVFSWFAILPFSFPDNTTSGQGHSVVYAAQPWSGHWDVVPTVWVVAHTTQFSMPGWRYLNSTAFSPSSSGSGTLPSGGTYVTMVSGDGKDFSIVIETAAATEAQTVTLSLTGAPEGTLTPPRRTPRPSRRAGGALTGRAAPPGAGSAGPSALRVWKTNETSYFGREADAAVRGGDVVLTLEPRAVYTLTTTSGQSRGARAPIAPSRSFPFPYRDSFDEYDPNRYYPRYFSDMGGVWTLNDEPKEPQTWPNTGGVSSGVLRQIITQRPISWTTNPDPASYIGDFNDPSTHPDQSWPPTQTLRARSRVDSVATADTELGVETQPCDAHDPSQAWVVSGGGGGGGGRGPFTIRGVGTDADRCLSMGPSYTPIPGGEYAVHVPCEAAPPPSQLWSLDPADPSGQRLNQSSGLCLDVAGEKTEPGTDVIEWPCKPPPDDKNQFWRVEHVPGAPVPGSVRLVAGLDGQCAQRRHRGSGAPSRTYLSLCGHIAVYSRQGKPKNGYCFEVHAGNGEPSTWRLHWSGSTLQNGTLASPVTLGAWQDLQLDLSAAPGSKTVAVKASLNGSSIATGTYSNGQGYGLAAIGSGWHKASVDSFEAVPLG